MATGNAQVELHEHGSGTRVAYAVRAAVGGKLGQIGGRMIDAAAKQIADQFFGALRVQLAPVAPFDETAAPLQESVAAGDPARAPAPAAAPVPVAATGEGARVLWFLLGVASTALGVWLGKTLF
jgi:hypothetical protein